VSKSWGNFHFKVNHSLRSVKANCKTPSEQYLFWKVLYKESTFEWN